MNNLPENKWDNCECIKGFALHDEKHLFSPKNTIILLLTIDKTTYYS